jgi:hypothetical protein
MVHLQDNNTEFNEFVKAQRDSLEARGETTLNLLVNLFKGYKASADDCFVTYIESKEDDYNEGQNKSPDMLMELAESKYKTLVETSQWKQPTAADRKIVALMAQLQALQVIKPDKETPAKRATDKKATDSTNKDAKWFLTPPKADKSKKKQKGGKDWWWCPNHAKKGKWVRHDPATCEQPKQATESAPAAPTKKEAEIAEKRLKVKTLTTLLNLKANEEDYDF